MGRRRSRGCSCCTGCREYASLGDAVGFERGPGRQVEVIDAPEFITDIADSPGDFGDCRCIYMGNYIANGCGSGIYTPRRNWRELRCWIKAGGRLVMVTEYNACIQNIEEVDAFLRYVAEGDEPIAHGDDRIACGCQPDMADAGSANIAQGLGPFSFGCFNSLRGGTPVAVWSDFTTDYTLAAVAPLGEGFVMIISDSNVWGSCGQGDQMLEVCRRYYEYDSEDII